MGARYRITAFEFIKHTMCLAKTVVPEQMRAQRTAGQRRDSNVSPKLKRCRQEAKLTSSVFKSSESSMPRPRREDRLRFFD